MELTARLQQLADWVPPGARLADVGTDHAYLPVWLLLHGRVVHAIASDLRKGPLERAKETARLYGTTEMECRLCNGLEGILPQEVDTIVVAGMGGQTIAEILKSAPWAKEGKRTLLLQPMSHGEDLRAFLANNGYVIAREALVLDRGTIYPVMEARGGEMVLSLGQIYGGTVLTGDPLWNQYLIEKIVRYMRAIGGLQYSKRQMDMERASHLREITRALMERREEWRRAYGSGD